MATTLVIARHGNTFLPGQTPTRIGAGTDLPLVETRRAENIGQYLLRNNLVPTAVYTAPLLRTMQTAQAAIQAAGAAIEPIILHDFTEIDYGPDENKSEEQVELRLGQGDRTKGRAIIEQWNQQATVPQGWNLDPQKIINTWLHFAQHTLVEHHHNQTTLVVTSNGIIRFAPYLTGDFASFASQNTLKVSTGSLCIFEKHDEQQFWTCKAWNHKGLLDG